MPPESCPPNYLNRLSCFLIQFALRLLPSADTYKSTTLDDLRTPKQGFGDRRSWSWACTFSLFNGNEASASSGTCQTLPCNARRPTLAYTRYVSTPGKSRREDLLDLAASGASALPFGRLRWKLPKTSAQQPGRQTMRGLSRIVLIAWTRHDMRAPSSGTMQARFELA